MSLLDLTHNLEAIIGDSSSRVGEKHRHDDDQLYVQALLVELRLGDHNIFRLADLVQLFQSEHAHVAIYFLNEYADIYEPTEDQELLAAHFRLAMQISRLVDLPTDVALRNLLFWRGKNKALARDVWFEAKDSLAIGNSWDRNTAWTKRTDEQSEKAAAEELAARIGFFLEVLQAMENLPGTVPEEKYEELTHWLKNHFNALLDQSYQGSTLLNAIKLLVEKPTK